MSLFGRVVSGIAADQLIGRFGGRNRLITAVALVLANLIPIAGVLWLGWKPGDILVVYWLENVVVAPFTFARILTARGGSIPSGAAVPAAAPMPPSYELRPAQLPRGCLAPFFLVHYGIFTAGHGVFTVLLAAVIGASLDIGGYLIAVAALLASYAITFGVQWIGRGERDVTTPQQAMWQPYPRLVVLHVTVLLGAFAMFSLILRQATAEAKGAIDLRGTAVLVPVLLLVGLKTVLDLMTLFWSQRRAGNRAAARFPQQYAQQ